MCRLLNKNELENNVDDILNKTKRISVKERSAKVEIKLPKIELNLFDKNRNAIKIYLKSNVLGTKRHVFISKHQKLSEKAILEKAKRLAEVYNITPIYSFNNWNITYLFSPKALDRERMKKALKSINALNLGSFMKYKFTIIPLNFKKESKLLIKNTSKKEELSKFHSKVFGLEGSVGKDKGSLFLGKMR